LTDEATNRWIGRAIRFLNCHDDNGIDNFPRNCHEAAICRGCFSGLMHLYGTNDPVSGRVRQVKGRLQSVAS